VRVRRGCGGERKPYEVVHTVNGGKRLFFLALVMEWVLFLFPAGFSSIPFTCTAYSSYITSECGR
jgi:hypothetical protein